MISFRVICFQHFELGQFHPPVVSRRRAERQRDLKCKRLPVNPLLCRTSVTMAPSGTHCQSIRWHRLPLHMMRTHTHTDIRSLEHLVSHLPCSVHKMLPAMEPLCLSNETHAHACTQQHTHQHTHTQLFNVFVCFGFP